MLLCGEEVLCVSWCCGVVKRLYVLVGAVVWWCGEEALFVSGCCGVVKRLCVLVGAVVW